MDLDLDRRVAVVTGASKGIGLAVTQTLLREGARVVATSHTRTPDLDSLDQDLLHVPADLMDPDAPAEVIARAVEAFGGIDILITNAGGPPPGAKLPRFGFLELTDDDWRDMFEFNLYSAVRTSRAAVPPMLERGGGAIVNVSSGLARHGSALNFDYSAAKAALINLTKSLSEELGPRGIRVNGVCPGPTKTPWWTDDGGAADTMAAQMGADRENVIATVAPEIMQMTTGRLVDPQEVADAVVLLASPRSASTTDTEIVVDGGFVKSI